jgi:hypothetical protein
VSEPPYEEDWPTQPGRGKPPQQQAPTRSGRPSQPDWIQPERSHALSPAGASQQPPSQPGRHSQPLLSDETQPLPLYRQPPVGEQWTAAPVQPPRFELPPPQFAPGGLWGSSPGPPASQPSQPPQPSQRNTNRATVVALAVLGALVVGGVTIGLVLSGGGTKKHDSHQLASNGPGGASTRDFPSAEPSGLRTDVASGTGVVTAEQAQIAQNAEDVLHAIATDDAAKFCPLIDPVDLQKLLKEKSLASCNEIKLKSTADSPLYQSFAVENPAAITVSGDTAHIPAVAIVPTSFGAVDMRKDSDGNWKFRFYSS